MQGSLLPSLDHSLEVFLHFFYYNPLSGINYQLLYQYQMGGVGSQLMTLHALE